MGKVTYVAFGDSITDGYGVSSGFVEHLAIWLSDQLPGREFKTFKSGWSGENSRDGLHKLDGEVLARKPDIVTINFGVNDAFSGVSPDEFERNMVEMTARVGDSGCSRIVLLSSEVIPDTWAERAVLPYWEAMKRAAAAEGVVYADVNGWWHRVLDAGRPVSELIIPGDLHPNAAGHRVIADAVIDAFEKNGMVEGL